MYESILLPTDGSEGSVRAAETAIVLAERFDATLHALSVVETADLSGEAPMAAIFDELEARARAALDDVADRAAEADIPSVETSIGSGEPHEVILDYVDEHDVDVIVMGTHGRTGVERYLIGSVTEKVVRLSDVPVVAVPMGPE